MSLLLAGAALVAGSWNWVGEFKSFFSCFFSFLFCFLVFVFVCLSFLFSVVGIYLEVCLLCFMLMFLSLERMGVESL